MAMQDAYIASLKLQQNNYNIDEARKFIGGI